ncbi:hypothetical protein G647_08411 [Cladophialophora carrionii CBS 160.54]|uniref:Uncharacterized protein n=1 Tax=Cladophialophora carrionii CBS 160.54 TaxID=1279043 RepID=V9D188_9EURO|nr:uncharacterized protein G647_08411 [Cladophialophora carrionii CBS 160.54]ETI20376.1 hypothetical protein G647_08411 [Cladophialophora carrionii CBS 160.54]
MLKQILPLSILYFTLVFLAGLVLDSVRLPYLQPLLGARYAELLETPLMIFIIWHAAQITVWNLDLDLGSMPKQSARWWSTMPLTIGLMSLTWLVTVEVGIMTILYDNWLWDALKLYFLQRDLVAGSVSGFVLLAYALMPWIVWLVGGQNGEDEAKLILDFDSVRTEDEDYCTR